MNHLCPQPLATTILSISMNFTTLGISYTWNHIRLSFGDRLISLSIMSSRFCWVVLPWKGVAVFCPVPFLCLIQILPSVLMYFIAEEYPRPCVVSVVISFVSFNLEAFLSLSLYFYDLDNWVKTGQLFCRVSLCLGLSVASWLDSGYALWLEEVVLSSLCVVLGAQAVH